MQQVAKQLVDGHPAFSSEHLELPLQLWSDSNVHPDILTQIVGDAVIDTENTSRRLTAAAA